MDIVNEWSPLLGALGAVVLSALLVGGRPSLRRSARFVASAAFVVLLVELVVVFLMLFVAMGPEGIVNNDTLYRLAIDVYRVADGMINPLAFGAWALLLYIAAQSSRRSRLVLFTVALTLALGVQIALTNPTTPLVDGLRAWMSGNPRWGEVVTLALGHITAIGALICALLPPSASATTTNLAPTLD